MKRSKLAVATLCLLASTQFVNAAIQEGPWLVRVRAIGVVPSANSNIINTIGGRVNSISTEIVPELDISYFYTNSVSTELILATARHHVYANGTSLGRVDLGTVNLLPPTLLLQYHFLPDQKFNPYLGIGVNYTYFYHANSGPVATSINYSNSFSPALQVGVDYAIDHHWSLNVDAKKIFVESIVNANTALGNLNPDVKLNPLILGLGVGYRFC
jgi:outer membrane protein